MTHEADLDPDLLDQLLADIASASEVLGAQIRTPSGMVRVAFSEAAARFREGTATAMQVQYRHDGVEWRDTLMQRPTAVRLVRIRIVPK